MNQFTLSLRDALANMEMSTLAEALQPEFVEFAGKKLKPGKYGRGKKYAKAFLIVDVDGNAYYQNKHGRVSKKLTEHAFLTHWDAGMSVYIEETMPTQFGMTDVEVGRE